MHVNMKTNTQGEGKTLCLFKLESSQGSNSTRRTNSGLHKDLKLIAFDVTQPFTKSGKVAQLMDHHQKRSQKVAVKNPHLYFLVILNLLEAVQL